MEPQELRLADAKAIVRTHTMAAVGAGVLPLPLIDGALISGVQLNMLRSLARLYALEFKEQLASSLVAALVGGALSTSSAGLFKLVPLVGSLAGVVSVPAIGGISTNAIGNLFIQHFESGGTFLTFDPAQVRKHYEAQVKTGKEEIKQKFIGILP